MDPSHPERPWRHRPVVRVTIHGSGEPFATAALVDSGADVSMFDAEVAERLGISLEDCERAPTMGIAGAPQETFRTTLTLAVDHLDPVEIPVLFMKGLNVIGGLLGQEGFFDEHRIKFGKDHKVFEISPVKKRGRGVSR